MSTAKCNAKSTKQGTLKLFDFKPLNEEEKVAKEAILKHRKEVAIETRRQQEIQEEVDERERELRETGNSTSDNATVGPYIVISGGTANNVTYNVNIASTIKPSYDYEPVLNDWQDNAKFSKNNIVTGKRKRVSKFL